MDNALEIFDGGKTQIVKQIARDLGTLQLTLREVHFNGPHLHNGLLELQWNMVCLVWAVVVWVENR